MEDKIRLTCSVCQAAIRVRAATKARFAICPKCQARTPIPERDRVPVEITSPMPGPEPTPAPEPAPEPEPAKEFTRADLAPATEVAPLSTEPSAAVDQGATPPAPMPAMEAPASEAPAPAAEEAPAPEEPKKGGLPSRKTGTRALPGKRSTLPGRRGLAGKEGEEAPKKSSKMLWIVVFLVVLVGGGAGAYFGGLIPMGGGGGGGDKQPQSGMGPVDKLFKAANDKDADALLKAVKNAPPTLKDDFKKAVDAVETYAVKYAIKDPTATKCNVEWTITWKPKPSSEPGGDPNPKEQSYSSTDEIVFEADGVPFDSLPPGFPIPKGMK